MVVADPVHLYRYLPPGVRSGRPRRRCRPLPSGGTSPRGRTKRPPGSPIRQASSSRSRSMPIARSAGRPARPVVGRDGLDRFVYQLAGEEGVFLASVSRITWTLSVLRPPNCFDPDCFKMLFSVFDGTSNRGLPETVTVPGFAGHLSHRWLPLVRASSRVSCPCYTLYDMLR